MDNFHLVPSEGFWEITDERTRRSIGKFETKEEALDMATTVIGELTASLKIHRADGTIEEERTYPRSMDPRGKG